jgi:hypothetical protein
MLYFTYKRTSNGRSGHIFGEILTVFIFHCFYFKESKILYNSSWDNQTIFKKENLLNYCIEETKTIKVNLDKIIRINKFKNSWSGIKFKEFTALQNIINNTDYNNKNVLIQLENVIKIHPYQLLEWFNNTLINEDIYTNILIPVLRNIYFNNELLYDLNTNTHIHTHTHTHIHTHTYIKQNTLNQISIHVRRGDLASRIINAGLDYNYYKNKINTILKNLPNIPIVIYCENENYDDLIPLKTINNVTLKLGGPDDLESDFNQLVRSKYLFISPCSMCVIAGYLNSNIVLYDNDILEKFRPAIINKLLGNCFINYNSSNLENILLENNNI